MGDTVEHIPPLKKLEPPDHKFLDSTAKTDQERRFSTGKHKDKKRPASKTHSDIKCLCDFTEKKAKEAGVDPENNRQANTNAICHRVEPEMCCWAEQRNRVTQFKWTTVLKKLREKWREEDEEEEE